MFPMLRDTKKQVLRYHYHRIGSANVRSISLHYAKSIREIDFPYHIRVIALRAALAHHWTIVLSIRETVRVQADQFASVTDVINSLPVWKRSGVNRGSGQIEYSLWKTSVNRLPEKVPVCIETHHHAAVFLNGIVTGVLVVCGNKYSPCANAERRDL